MCQSGDFNSIEQIRSKIDDIDKKIISLLGERFEYVKGVVNFKQPTKDSIIAKERFDAVIENRKELAKAEGLNPEIIGKVYTDLLEYFIDEQLKLIKK